MYLNTIDELNEIKSLSVPDFDIDVGLFERSDKSISIVSKSPTLDYRGDFVGFSEMKTFSNAEELSIHTEQLLTKNLPLSCQYNHELIKNEDTLNFIKMILLLEDASFYITIPRFIKNCQHTEISGKQAEVFDLDELFNYKQPSQEEKSQKISEKVNKTIDIFKKLILIHLSLEDKIKQYHKGTIVESREYAVEDIPSLIDLFTVKEANLFALYCMVDLPLYGEIGHINRFNYLKKFGSLDLKTMTDLGFSSECIDDIFHQYKIHKDYFILKAKAGKPLLVYLDPYTNDDNCLLSMKNELMAWKGFTSLMQEQESFVKVTYEPADRG